MSAEDARINLILDELVRQLRAIDGDPSLYLTAPKRVLRWSQNPLAEPTPCIIVKCVKWGPNEPQTGLQHDAEATIEVRVIVGFGGSVDDPDRELHRVIRDVISQVQNNWQLPLSGVPSMSIHVIDGYEASDSLGSAQGFAEATVGFRAKWPWDAAQP